MGLRSLATAAVIGWEGLKLKIDIFATFEVTHYRPKDGPKFRSHRPRKPARKIGFRWSMPKRVLGHTQPEAKTSTIRLHQIGSCV
jgi:hypothetical protein